MYVEHFIKQNHNLPISKLVILFTYAYMYECKINGQVKATNLSYQKFVLSEIRQNTY